MAKFIVCDKCGANLDYGERCDCNGAVEVRSDHTRSGLDLRYQYDPEKRRKLAAARADLNGRARAGAHNG